MSEAPAVIRRGMVTHSPHDLNGLLHPLYSGVRKYAKDNGIDTTKGSWALTLTWTEAT